MTLNGTIEGLQEAQAWNNRKIATLRVSGAMGRAVRYGTTAAHRGAVARTHVDTGALRASHRMALYGDEGTVSIEAGATNPRSGLLTAVYGAMEHGRGGSHAFYARTVEEDGQVIGQEMLRIIRGEVRQA
jgi:hypothetical protein